MMHALASLEVDVERVLSIMEDGERFTRIEQDGVVNRLDDKPSGEE